MYLETKIVPSSETRKFSPFKKTQIAHQAAEREEEAVDDSQQPKQQTLETYPITVLLKITQRTTTIPPPSLCDHQPIPKPLELVAQMTRRAKRAWRES